MPTANDHIEYATSLVGRAHSGLLAMQASGVPRSAGNLRDVKANLEGALKSIDIALKGTKD